MKKYIILTAILACLAAGCAKSPASLSTDATRRYLEAWVHVQKQKHPEYLWKQTPLGAWILEDKEGSGKALGEFGDSTYVRVNFSFSNLDGTISSTTLERIAKQLGQYNETHYYGPHIWYAKGVYAGLEDALKGMKPGGRRKVMVPSWLLNYTRYTTEEEYLAADQSKNGDTGIYDLELVEFFDYVNEWELDSIGRYLARNFSKEFGTDASKARADSAGAHGFYYVQTEAPSDTVTLNDTTVYINYIGRLLNGKVFDTTIRDTAIFHGIYSESRTYGPVTVQIGDEWSNTTMGSDSNKIIKGFARTISKMKSFEKGTGIFYSPIGYGYKGSGSSIPGYSPLRFDVELVAAPKK